MAIPTHVDSINGYQGSKPFRSDPGITLDASDIRVSGSTGTTVKAKCQSLAGDIRMLEIVELEEDGDYRMRIGAYSLVLTG